MEGQVTLKFAVHAAGRLVGWLTPFCERIAVAGSIRRERPAPADIDLVAIPRIAVQHDLLGAECARRNLLFEEIARRVAAEARWELVRGGTEAAQNVCTFIANAVQVDVFCATDQTWGTVLLCRTGSKDHNIWLAQRAQRFGGHWNPHQSLTIRARAIPTFTEEAIYTALDVRFIEPKDREIEYLRRLT